MTRPDLLELSTDALMALSNPGFVKRAQKDIAAGLLPTLTVNEQGVIHAQFDDGTLTSIAPKQGLKESSCSCPASNMCRHRIALVLSYQVSQTTVAEVEWNPALFTDEIVAQHFTAKVIEQARKQAADLPVATVSQSDGVPYVRLPMNVVRFFSRNHLAHARCDCVAGHGCVHIVLAVWACRQAQEEQPDKQDVTLNIHAFARRKLAHQPQLFHYPEIQALSQDIQLFLWSIWRDGSAQPLLALEARYQQLQQAITQQGWTWVAVALEDIWQMLQAQAHRSSSFDIERLLLQISQLWARLHIAQQADFQAQAAIPTSQILGIGQRGEVALDQMRLISLGATFWQDDQQEGVEIVFADSDTQSISVVSRTWPISTAGELFKHRVAGATVSAIATGQVISKAVKRRANAHIELGRLSRQTSVLPLSHKAWRDLQAPIRFSQLADLIHYLQQRPPNCLLPCQAGSNWHIVELADLSLENWLWDAKQQTLFAYWPQLTAHLSHQALTPWAIDTFSRVLAGEWGTLHSIAGPVKLTAQGLYIHPVSVMTEQRAIVLALEPSASQTLPLQQHSINNLAILDETKQLLGTILRQGIRHLSHTLQTRIQQQVIQLQQSGFEQTAQLLQHFKQDLAHSARLVLLLERM